MLRIFRRALPLLLAALTTGCGTGGMAPGGVAADGEALFQEKCGQCHVLEAAGTRGTIGPNLDASYAAPRAEGFDETSFRETVLGQMRFPIPPMPPPNELFPLGPDYTREDRERDMHAIATYVAGVVANEEAIAQAQQRGGTALEDETDPRAIFAAACASCHVFGAADATGTIGPPLDGTNLSIEEIAQQIREGGGGMPAFDDQLSDEQIQALSNWIRENR